MSHACVNQGGRDSRISCDTVLQLEQECFLGAAGLQALQIWQARPGEVMTAVDAQQRYFRARISALDAEQAMVIPFAELESPESPLEICVYQALPEKERFELVLQKLTEIGVMRIVPFVSEHSTTLEKRDAGQRKSHRWPDVLLKAARQCRRAQLPELAEVHSWSQMLNSLADEDVKLLLSEKGTGWSFREGLGSSRPDRLALIIGPEGGFEESEIDEAQQYGVVPVSLGSRILRTETAAIVAASLAQFCVGDYA
ncbi:MAG: 16S rRNA (uracil(1498)-N(3))-methyltransferase [Desulfuromonas sp.]|nr:16S rRNA (uracil(1498)-N(3))-methyltransferase [Desulfuromonas sp.]